MFAQLSVEYLGYTISKGKRKVDAILDMPTPTNVSSLRSFLGSIQFYGKFIKDLSTLTEPLYCLLKKGVPWRWGNQEQQAFECLKSILCTDAVLAHFNPPEQIGIGIGAVLFHCYSDGTERPITNASKTLSATQRRYSQVQKEALAVI